MNGVNDCKLCEGWKLKEKPKPWINAYVHTCDPECPYLTAKEYLEGYCNFLEVDLAWWDYYVASCAYDGM